ncbi:MAG: IS3 family transposase [Bacteroidetes bacterium]|nr:IS3 family transposase [Bacteroidota bacterium]
MVTPYQKEQCLIYIREHYPKVSHAKACKLMNCSRTNKYYNKKMPKKDEVVKEVIMNAMGTSRIGRRKVIVKVRRKNPDLGSSRIRRVYEQSGLSLYKRHKRKRINNPANPISVPMEKNQEWAMDFMSDALANGSKIRTLNIIDQYNRKCVSIEIERSFPSRKVIEAVKKAIHEHGKPKGIRTDNGPEFTSQVFQQWLEDNGIEWIRIQKGKPQQNAIVERFNRTFREDILDAYNFFSLDHARELTSDWINNYNDDRPHEALNYKTPNEYAA